MGDASLDHLDTKFHQLMADEDGFHACWIVADGTTGMMMQSIAMAEALGKDAPVFKAISTPILRLRPQLGAWPGWPLVVGKKPNFLKGRLPKLLITTGRRMAGFSIGMRRISQGKTKTLHIQDARVPAHYFDLMVVPAHDPLGQENIRPDNVIISKAALNRLTQDHIQQAADALPALYHKRKGKQILLMVGGRNRRYTPAKTDFVRLARSVQALAQSQDASVIIVPSGRTPKQHLAAMMAECNPDRTLLWDSATPNPYPGLLGIVDMIVVTSDSVNMVSEACLTGKPVFVAELCAETGRLADFHQRMKQAGHTRPLNAQPDLSPPVILDDMPDIARQVKEKLIPILES